MGLHRLYGGVREEHAGHIVADPDTHPDSVDVLANPDTYPTTSSGGCSASAWVSSQAYVAGDVVSYGGSKWNANQWNYDEVPGGPSGAWNSDGPC